MVYHFKCSLFVVICLARAVENFSFPKEYSFQKLSELQKFGQSRANAPERCPLGRYELDYALLGQPYRLPGDPSPLRDRNFGGWLLFQISTHHEFQPVPFQPVPFSDAIECWLGKQYPQRFFPLDSAHADFRRASIVAPTIGEKPDLPATPVA